MTHFAARFAGVATLALALLPVAALSTAHAAAHPPARVHVADLDLRSAAGQAQFAARADAAAHRFCATEASLGQKAACEAAVRAELAEKAQVAAVQVAARS